MIRPSSKKNNDDRAPLSAVRLSDMAPKNTHPVEAEPDIPDFEPRARTGKKTRGKTFGEGADKRATKPASRQDRATGPKAGRKMTAARIHNIAEHYVTTREASQAMLRGVLSRRLWKRCAGLDAEAAELERQEAEPLIEAEILKLVKAGFVDDSRFAEMKARSWLHSGRGTRRIAMDLAQKGVAKEVIEDAITEAARELTGVLSSDLPEDEILRSAEDEAADAFAKKKKVGRYRRQPMPEDRMEAAKLWRREAAAMARAGFSMDLIRQTLDQPPDEDDF